jgi:hypothetical protein
MELIRYAVAVLALAVLGKPSREPQPIAAPSTPAPAADDPTAYPIGDMQVREVVLRGERWREVYINDIYIGMAKAG